MRVGKGEAHLKDTLWRRSPAVVLAAAVLFTLLSPAGAQEREPRFDPRSYIMLPGQGAAVRYSAGSLDRAHHVLRRLEVLAHNFQRWLGEPVPVAAYVVERQEWNGFSRPYGIPVRIGRSTVAVPALGDEGTVELWRRLLELEPLPMIPGMPLRGTPEQAATLALSDVLLQLEASRGFVVSAGLLGEAAWISEVVSHVVALNIFHEHERRRLAEISTTYRRLLEQTADAGAHHLAAYRPDLPLESWLWYHANFFRGAEIILDKTGKKSVNKLLQLKRKSDGFLSTAALMKRYPDLRAWLTTSFDHKVAADSR